MQHDVAPQTLINGFTQSSSSGSLRDVCAQLHARVDAFLKKKPTSDIEKRVQERTKTSVHVIRDALDRYEYATEQEYMSVAPC